MSTLEIVKYIAKKINDISICTFLFLLGKDVLHIRKLIYNDHSKDVILKFEPSTILTLGTEGSPSKGWS